VYSVLKRLLVGRPLPSAEQEHQRLIILHVLVPLAALAALGYLVPIASIVVVLRHYREVTQALAVPDDWRPPRLNHTVVVLVGGVHRGVLEASAYARSLHPDHLVAVTVVSDEDEQARIAAQWEARGLELPLDIVDSPYRELSRPILRFLDEVDARWKNDIVTVLIPEFVVRRWWEQLLHNQTALFLKGRLLFREGVVVTSVPYHLRSRDQVGTDPLITRAAVED
jgi:hypothetical protein